MLRLTYWANIPTPYHLDLCRALAALPEVEVRLVFAHPVPPERRALGWQSEISRDDTKALEVRFLGGSLMAQALRLAAAERDRLHCFHGIWANTALTGALILNRLEQRPFLIYAEASNPYIRRSGAKEAVKRLLGHWIGRWRGARLLAVSRFAREFYRPFGFEGDRVLPFGYYRAAPPLELVNQPPQLGANIVYVGQFIPRKGLDLLIEAARPLFAQSPDFRLTLYGGGIQENALRQQASGLNPVHFGGVIPTEQARARIAGAAALVLPSRWDGWGLVVNEALSVGVPCLVSDQCGAAEVITPGLNGEVFHGGDVEALRVCLEAHLSRRDRWETMRTAARQSGATLCADQAARRLVEWLQGEEV